jgi:thiol-disulfide isomerase/thioredoxin
MGFYSFINKDTTVINATYLQTDTFPNDFETDINGNTIFKTAFIDFYLLTSCQDKELLSSLEVTKSGFWGYNVDSSQYDTELDEYTDLVKKYPDSHSLIQSLNFTLNLFRSKNDVQKIFDCFSQDNKNSFYGKRLNQYLTDNYFKNSILKTWDTGKNEAIVIDSTKYNLILFSSTGCRPCIEEIPVLKQIYKDLSDMLDMTYVSIDNSKMVDGWRDFMRKENIPWRSVLAEDNIDNIIEKYHVLGTPYCLFVHPDGFMESIDVRIKEDKDKLYSLCGKS